jgi:hypothetical protein
LLLASKQTSGAHSYFAPNQEKVEKSKPVAARYGVMRGPPGRSASAALGKSLFSELDNGCERRDSGGEHDPQADREAQREGVEITAERVYSGFQLRSQCIDLGLDLGPQLPSHCIEIIARRSATSGPGYGGRKQQRIGPDFPVIPRAGKG